MTLEKLKEIHAAKLVIRAIDNNVIFLLSKEKEVTKKALLRYIEQLEAEGREEVAVFRKSHVLYRDKNGVIEEEKEDESDER